MSNRIIAAGQRKMDKAYIKELQAENARLREALEFAKMTIEDALTLGYLRKWSTKKMAHDTIFEMERALSGRRSKQ